MTHELGSTMSTKAILERLIAFDTVSRHSNMALIHYVQSLLSEHKIDSKLIPSDDAKKANLYAMVGPDKSGGVMLSGHTDVVPIDGQNWTKPAFKLTEENERYYGRGTTDMKGFIASALSIAIEASQHKLRSPLHIALSYDEEIGCVGVHSMISMLQNSPSKPSICIVGEPTSLNVATAHKGKTAIRVKCTGQEGHSALAPKALNAIYMASDIISIIRDTQNSIKRRCSKQQIEDVDYTTLHVGKINAGVALNIVPNSCIFDFEIRNVAGDDPNTILDNIKKRADEMLAPLKSEFSQADLNYTIINQYPGLDTPLDSQVVEFVKSLTGAHNTTTVAFGTEGGLFSSVLSVPTVVCGPGSMDQGHKPDEYIEKSELKRCDDMLAKLLHFLQKNKI